MNDQKPEHYEVGKHTKAREAIRKIRADIARGEAYLILQDLMEIDAALILASNPSERTKEKRQKLAERLEEIFTQHSGLDKWKGISEGPYKVVKTTSEDEYDLIWRIEKLTRSGKSKLVATARGAYEFGTYRISLIKDGKRIEYEGRPDTYGGCETKLAEIAEQTIAELRAKKV